MINKTIINTSLDTEMYIRNGKYLGYTISRVTNQIPEKYDYIKKELESFPRDMLIRDIRCSLFSDLAMLLNNARGDVEFFSLLFNNISDKVEIDNFVKYLSTYAFGRDVLQNLISRMEEIEITTYAKLSHIVSLKRYSVKFANPIRKSNLVTSDANLEDLSIVPYRKIMFEKRDRMYDNYPTDFTAFGMRFTKRRIEQDRNSLNREAFSGNISLPTIGNTVILSKELFRYMNLFDDYDEVYYNPKDYDMPITGLDALEKFKYLDIDVFAKTILDAVTTDEENAYNVIYSHIDERYKIGLYDMKKIPLNILIQKILLEISMKAISCKMKEGRPSLIYRWACEELNNGKIYVYKPNEESRRYLRKISDKYYKFKDRTVIPNIVYLAINISNTLDETAVTQDKLYLLTDDASNFFNESRACIGLGGRSNV